MAKKKKSQRLQNIVVKYSTGKSKEGKVDAQNFVTKHSMNKSGAGAHEDKTGDKSSRARQKRDWKKDINEDISNGKMINDFDAQTRDMLLDVGANPDLPIRLNHLYKNDLRRFGTSIKKIGETAHGKDLYGSNSNKANTYWIISDTYNQFNENSLIAQIHETYSYENGDDFDRALKDIEQKFDINLMEQFTRQQHDDMAKLIGHHEQSFFRDNAAEEIANDLEQLEYQPDEIEQMVPHIMQQIQELRNQ